MDLFDAVKWCACVVGHGGGSGGAWHYAERSGVAADCTGLPDGGMTRILMNLCMTDSDSVSYWYIINYYNTDRWSIKMVKEYYENILKPNLEKIKTDLIPVPERPLHLYDMRKNVNGFEFLSDVKMRNSLFNRIKNLLQSLNINVFAASIDTDKYKNMYYSKTNDIYDIALQTIGHIHVV